MAPAEPAPVPVNAGDKDTSNLDVATKQDTNVEGSIATTERTVVEVFSKKAIVASWAALALVALLNYLDLGMIYTFQVYAVSDFNRLSIEAALMTALSVATIGEKTRRGPLLC